MTRVCVDANIVIALLLQEPESAQVDVLFQKWKADGVEIIMPAFGAAEVDSAIRRRVRMKELTPEVGEAAFRAAVQLPIRFDSADCRHSAWELATELDLATVYDAVYLALADLRGCEFHTADQKLYAQVKERLPFVRLLSLTANP